MTNTNRLLEIARQGSEAWNDWRVRYPEEEVDFSNVDFTLDENQGISFEGFKFGNSTDFKGAKFGDYVSFLASKFGDFAAFDDAIFGDGVLFNHATFGEGASFYNTVFGHVSQFKGATFGGTTSFARATFGNNAKFEAAIFGSGAWFEHAAFAHAPNFRGSTFKGDTWFRGTIFGNAADFEGATFQGGADFDGKRLKSAPGKDADATQPSYQNGAGTYFGSISFSGASFFGEASFVTRDFQAQANFSTVSFFLPPDFRATEHRENLDWTGVRFGSGRHLKLGRFAVPIRGWANQSDTVARLRRLRGLAKEIHAVDAERDLFILERQAERSILWREWWRGNTLHQLFGWWRPLSATVLMFLYRYSSNCGRSILLPLTWLAASNWGFYHLYPRLIEQPLTSSAKSAVFDLTFSSAVPFGATARPAFQSAMTTLFQNKITGAIDIPWQIQAASTAQGITNLVLVFLLGLALRNYFKFR